VKILGGRWDATKKKWYISDKSLLEKVRPWHRVFLASDKSLQEDPPQSDAKWDFAEGKWYVLGYPSGWVDDVTSLVPHTPIAQVSTNTPPLFRVDGPLPDLTIYEPIDRTHKAIFFDLETNGLPGPQSSKTRFDSSRIVQMSYLLCDCDSLTDIESLGDHKYESETGDLLIRADGFPIDNSHIHGITLENSLANGLPFQDVMALIAPTFLQAQYIVAHNAEFDVPIFRSELRRHGESALLTHLESMTVVCSMLRTKRLMNLADKRGKLKNPNMKELYRFATNEDIVNQHNAKYDVINLHKAIRALVSREALSLDTFFSKQQ
jgi:DNA polymerase III epsilon subunit-like protein